MAPKKSAAAGNAAIDSTPPAVTVVDGEFPKMLYHPKGQQQTVGDAEAQDKWEKRGYGEDPPDA